MDIELEIIEEAVQIIKKNKNDSNCIKEQCMLIIQNARKIKDRNE